MKKLVTLLVLSALLVIGCGPNTPPVEVADTKDMPDWATGVSAQDVYYGIGMAKMAEIPNSMNRAQVMARQSIATQVEIKVAAMLKSFSQESGGQVLDFYENVTKQVADESLRGCKAAGGIYSNNSMYFAKDGTGGALMEYSLASVAQNALDAFKGPSEEALYNEFKASQAFKELDAAVEKPD